MELAKFALLWVKTGAVPWIRERMDTGLKHWKDFGSGYRMLLLGFVFSGGLLVLISWYKVRSETRKYPLRIASRDDWSLMDEDEGLLSLCAALF